MCNACGCCYWISDISVIPSSHWSYVNEDLAAPMTNGQSVMGTPRTYWELSWNLYWRDIVSKLPYSCYVRATSLLSSLCGAEVPTDFYVRAGRGACGVGKFSATSAQIETGCSYVYTASAGCPLRHADVKGQTEDEKVSTGRVKKTAETPTPMPESVTLMHMSKTELSLSCCYVLTVNMTCPLRLCYADSSSKESTYCVLFRRRSFYVGYLHVQSPRSTNAASGDHATSITRLQ
jgi:hypothetical protein